MAKLKAGGEGLAGSGDDWPVAACGVSCYEHHAWLCSLPRPCAGKLGWKPGL